jgi:hypothetical protein
MSLPMLAQSSKIEGLSEMKVFYLPHYAPKIDQSMLAQKMIKDVYARFKPKMCLMV